MCVCVVVVGAPTIGCCFGIDPVLQSCRSTGDQQQQRKHRLVTAHQNLDNDVVRCLLHVCNDEATDNDNNNDDHHCYYNYNDCHHSDH